MEYTRLTEDDKRQIVEQRLAQLEAEHFSQTISCAQLATTDDGSEQSKQAIHLANQRLAALDVAYERTKAELDSAEET